MILLGVSVLNRPGDTFRESQFREESFIFSFEKFR